MVCFHLLSLTFFTSCARLTFYYLPFFFHFFLLHFFRRWSSIFNCSFILSFAFFDNRFTPFLYISYIHFLHHSLRYPSSHHSHHGLVRMRRHGRSGRCPAAQHQPWCLLARTGSRYVAPLHCTIFILLLRPSIVSLYPSGPNTNR